MLNGDSQAAAVPGARVSENPLSLGASPTVIQQIEAMTRSVFPGPVSYEHVHDPENPADEWFVFDVIAAGKYEDYCERVFQWHDEVERIVPGTRCEFRLSVMPQR